MFLWVVGASALVGFFSNTADAAAVECAGPLGTCSVTNDVVDMADCDCIDGGNIGFGGGNRWAGLSEEELTVICDDLIEPMCGAPPLPDTNCGNEDGACSVTEDGGVSCECDDGSGFGMPGMRGVQLSDPEQQALCEENLVFCGDGPVGTDGGTSDTGPGDGGDSGDTDDGGSTDDGGTSGGGTSGGGTSGGDSGDGDSGDGDAGGTSSSDANGDSPDGGDEPGGDTNAGGSTSGHGDHGSDDGATGDDGASAGGSGRSSNEGGCSVGGGSGVGLAMLALFGMLRRRTWLGVTSLPS